MKPNYAYIAALIGSLIATSIAIWRSGNPLALDLFNGLLWFAFTVMALRIARILGFRDDSPLRRFTYAAVAVAIPIIVGFNTTFN